MDAFVKKKSTCGNEWLDTCELWKYGKKLEEKHPNFCFLGVYASDLFGRIENTNISICGNQPDLQRKLNECEKVGYIMNTDPSYKSGKHWVSVYGEKNKATILIDSGGGNNLNSYTRNSMIYMSLKMKYPVSYCLTNTQQKDLCGWYALVHLDEAIQGKSCKDMKKLNDTIIQSSRGFFEDTIECNFF